MKRLIYQVSVGKPSYLYEWCIQSVKDYCDQYGIDHIVQTEPILKIAPLDWSKSNRSENVRKFGYLPIYEKENAFSYFDRYDQIAIIDSDIFIKPQAPNIFDELNDDTDFAGVVEREMPITPEYARKITAYSHGQYAALSAHNNVDFKPNNLGYEFYNMGMMLMNKSITEHINGTPEEFIRRDEFRDFVDGIGNWKWSTDQTLLNYWVKSTGMKEQHLSFKWNALFKAVQDKCLEDAYLVHFFLKDKLPGKGENIELLQNALDGMNINFKHV
tara:strand:+ start:56 stop:871 length:816 start_codon:yes stop_codon:yes gene_type:complete